MPSGAQESQGRQRAHALLPWWPVGLGSVGECFPHREAWGQVDKGWHSCREHISSVSPQPCHWPQGCTEGTPTFPVPYMRRQQSQYGFPGRLGPDEGGALPARGECQPHCKQ